jgi:hypothetical protein
LKKGLFKFLDNESGNIGLCAKYTHSDIVLSLFAKSLTQGTLLSDLRTVKAKLAGQQFSPISSPDTVEYVWLRLKQFNLIKMTRDGIVHELNYDNRLNVLLIKLAIKNYRFGWRNPFRINEFNNYRPCLLATAMITYFVIKKP